MTDFREATPEESRRPEQIESEIRRTRDRMGDGIEAIGDRLRPERIKQRAKAAMQRKGANLFRTAKENPVPTAIVALGLTLLLKARSKQREQENGYSEWKAEDDHPGLKEKTQEIAGNAKDKALAIIGHAGEQVAQKAKSTSYSLQDFFQRNPIIAGAGVVVLGAAIGALIPETQKENKLLGHARDQMVEKTKTVVQQAQGAIEQKMSEQRPSNAQQEQPYGTGRYGTGR